ncbi:uncharacterized protein [Haliotis cracherodii]|uniref:uncharacterized protein n=1 Tax=Haliotis cracherodii TaxID=6455 RepID=UPI0039EADD26
MTAFVMCKFVSVVSLLLQIHSYSCSRCEKTQLVPLADFDNLFVNEHLLWNDQMDSVAACISRCFLDTRCRSVQVHGITSGCTGHATGFASPTKIYPPATAREGSRLFLLPRASHYIGSACASDGDCHVATSVCNDGICTCQIGYWFSSSQQACVTECSSLGPGLVRYNGHAIFGYDMAEHLMEETSCQHLCNGTCSSLDYDEKRSRCYINNGTYLSVDVASRGEGDKWVYYQRNCAQ